LTNQTEKMIKIFVAIVNQKNKNYIIGNHILKPGATFKNDAPEEDTWQMVLRVYCTQEPVGLSPEHAQQSYNYDVVVGADGKLSILSAENE